MEFNINNRRYLGSKFKLIDFIHEVVNENCPDIRTVMDLFAGTGVVGYSFNHEYGIILNDTLVGNSFIYQTFFGKGKVSKPKLKRIIDQYNTVTTIDDNYYSLNFADTYLSQENMRKVGYIRDNIDLLYADNEINERERAILICSLLYAIDKIANTVGHYDAYRKNGNLTSLLQLSMPNLDDDPFNKNNVIFEEDSNELVKHIGADLVYIDPPYNSRQYCDAYHFLENVAENKKPKVYGVARKMDRQKTKSQYCTSKAPDAFASLIEDIEAKYILVSYSDTGTKGNDRSNAKISDEQILNILSRKGEVQVFEQDHNIFTTGKTQIKDHKERLFLCKVGQPTQREQAVSRKQDAVLVKSPLNYTGGKFKIINQLLAKFPSDIGTFYDVFCGGENVGINVNAKKIICIDNDPELIQLLQFLQANDYYDLVKHIDNLIDVYHLSNTYLNGYDFYGCSSDNGVGQYNNNYFKVLKEDYNKSNGERNDLFLLLIIYSFNNQIRFNSKGEFNIPVGKRDFNASLRTKLEKFMFALKVKPICFRQMDFRDIDLESINCFDDFLYLDPPYYLGTASYNENNGWTNYDEEDLLSFLNRCDRKNLRFALSNVIEHKGKINDRLLHWCLDNKYNINYISRSYQNANYHIKDKEASTKEVLVTNF